MYVHDRLISRISYSKAATMNQSAYSALVGGKTVCAGYARAFQYLMQKLGIPCYYCTGFAGENHAWNIIKLSDALDTLKKFDNQGDIRLLTVTNDEVTMKVYDDTLMVKEFKLLSFNHKKNIIQFLL